MNIIKILIPSRECVFELSTKSRKNTKSLLNIILDAFKENFPNDKPLNIEYLQICGKKYLPTEKVRIDSNCKTVIVSEREKVDQRKKPVAPSLDIQEIKTKRRKRSTSSKNYSESSVFTDSENSERSSQDDPQTPISYRRSSRSSFRSFDEALFDFELFKNQFSMSNEPQSPIKKLAKAIKQKNTSLLKEVLASENLSFDLFTKENDGITPLILCTQYEYLEGCRELIELGVSVDEEDQEGYTALHWAGYNGNAEIVDFLIQKGASPSHQSRSGKTPIYSSFNRNQKKCVLIMIKMCMKTLIKTITFKKKSDDFDDSIEEDDSIGGWNELHIAVLENDISKVEEILSKKEIEINSRSSNEGFAALHLAVDFPECLKLLLDNGADVNLIDNFFETPLHKASQIGNLKSVEILVSSKANINFNNIFQATPIHFCATEGHVECMNVLLKNGANPNSVDFSLSTPLNDASYNGKIECVKLLLEQKNILVNTSDQVGFTPLHDACSNGNLEIIDLLLEAGANIEAKDIRGKTALIICTIYNQMEAFLLLLRHGAQLLNSDNEKATSLHWAVSEYKIEIATKIMEIIHKNRSKYNMDITDQDGVTAVHEAAYIGNLEVIELLVQYGANFQARSSEGWTALHWAGHGGCVKSVEKVLSFGAEIDAFDFTGRTPLFVAVEAEMMGAIQTLVENGANILQCNYTGCSILHTMANTKSSDVIDFILNSLRTRCAEISQLKVEVLDLNNFSPTPTNSLSESTKTKLSTFLELDDHTQSTFKSMLNMRDYEKKTAIMHCCEKGNDLFLTKLLKSGAEPSLKDISEQTPLHLAALNNEAKCIELLFKNSQCLQLPDNLGHFPLHCCSATRSFESAQILLHNNADVNCRDKLLSTPLHDAACNNDVRSIALFLDFNANINISDSAGVTPILAAAMSGAIDAVMFLIQAGADLLCLDNEKNNIFHFVVQSDSPKLLQFLLDFPHLLNIVNKTNIYNKSPLDISLDLENHEMSELLLPFSSDF